MCQCTPPDGNRSSLCKTASHSFWCLKNALTFARPYMMLYLLGTLPSMIATGMNPFINAQGYSTTGMFSVAIGAIANILLDPLFIFYLPSGRKRCSGRHCIVTDFICTVCVSFSAPQSGDQSPPASKNELSSCIPLAKSIISLGTSGFIMQLTNSLVSICCNHVPLRHRWRCVRLCHDNCLKCPPDGGNSDLCDHGRFLPNHKLQLWCPPPHARQKPASRWLLWRSSIPASCGA